jgi:hypothetical protein
MGEDGKGENRYYDGMLYLTSLVQASGEFRVWGPGRMEGTGFEREICDSYWLWKTDLSIASSY